VGNLVRRSVVVVAAIIGQAAWSMALGGERIDFARDVQPVLTQHCTRCHGGVKRAGGLLLSPAAGMPAAGDSGVTPIVPGKVQESELFRRVTATDPGERMPAESLPLSEEEVAKLRQWIEEGAVWPLHWSLQPVREIALADHSNAAWARTGIDAFVSARLEAKNVAPSPPADRYTLIRRLSLDLCGLPPAPAEADAFAIAQAPDAYEQLVDRLLANPRFGERWGRHWLDQARYADSDGYEVDKARPDAYRWRDWVITAVNCDMPLDRFTIEQFAGDLLPDADPISRLATAYHRQTFTNNEGGVDKEEYRLKAVLDRVSNTGAVWLGMTLGCAQCHDHPYDPFTQRDYFALAAIFNNAEEVEIEVPDGAAVARPSKFRVLAERETPRSTRLLKRGEFLQPGDEVLPALPAMAGGARTGDRHDVTRLDLAHWLVDSANPLTARMAANQIWLRLFGQGLVRTPEDFGARGQPPTHPELLDWLASELAQRGWSRKTLIRQIVLSATYRQESRHRNELEAVDPLNLLVARQNRIRVEAEIVRDVHLAAGGLLSNRIGGPSVFPPLAAEFVKITFRSELPWKTSAGGDRYRRGMYTFFKRSVPYPDLMTFDCPDASAATAQRATSNTPLQALTTLNSETCLEAATGLAAQLLSLQPWSDYEVVDSAFRICLTRPPSGKETARLVELLRDHRRWYDNHPDDAKLMTQSLKLANATEAQAAALVATANVIMNLDEFITRD
jgi:Protein of unknown function (DUF1553)/Protein of unknown function (DUF1549)/Planctomycete cytochrome C